MTQRRSLRRRRRRQRGSAMLVTLLIIAALLAGASVLVGLQMTANRSTDLTRSGMSALYCAEAGLTAARPVVLANYAQWATALDEFVTGDQEDPAEPAWLETGINTTMGGHDLDGTGTAVDFKVWIEDNHDETTTNNESVDSDLRVFIVSRCEAFPDTKKEVRELVEWNGVFECRGWMLGGCDGDGTE